MFTRNANLAVRGGVNHNQTLWSANGAKSQYVFQYVLADLQAVPTGSAHYALSSYFHACLSDMGETQTYMWMVKGFFGTPSFNCRVRLTADPVTATTSNQRSGFIARWLPDNTDFYDGDPYNALLKCLIGKASDDEYLYFAGSDCMFTATQASPATFTGWWLWLGDHTFGPSWSVSNLQSHLSVLHRTLGVTDSGSHKQFGTFEEAIAFMIETNLA